MDRKHFLKSALLTTGGLLMGGAAIYQYLNSKETTGDPLPLVIDKIHHGNMKKVLVIMSAGTKLGNTDRLTDAYIKGLVERGHSVTKVYLGSMRIEGCRGCGVCQRFAHQCAIKDGMQDIYPLFAECDTVVMIMKLLLNSLSDISGFSIKHWDGMRWEFIVLEAVPDAKN